MQNEIAAKCVCSFLYLYALIFLSWLKYTMTIDNRNVRKDNDSTNFVLANHCSK